MSDDLQRSVEMMDLGESIAKLLGIGEEEFSEALQEKINTKDKEILEKLRQLVRLYGELPVFILQKWDYNLDPVLKKPIRLMMIPPPSEL